MNKTLKLFLILSILNFIKSIYPLTVGNIDHIITVSEYGQVKSHNCYVMDIIPYVSGGVSLICPKDDDPDISTIFVSIELKKRAYSRSEIIMPIITSNSELGITVRVNIFDGTSVFEAETDDVSVHILAYCAD